MDARLYEQFAKLEDCHWWLRGRRAVIREVLRRKLPPHRSRRILDVGCGTGGQLQMLQEFGVVEGLEHSRYALDCARKRLGPDVPLYEGSLPDGIPRGRTYELITAFDVLEHIEHDVEALRSIREALAPGGTFVCTVPAFQFLWSRHDELNEHHRRYDAPGLERALNEAGFSVHWHSYFNTALFLPIAAVRMVRKLVPDRDDEPELKETPEPLNRLLETIFGAERRVVPYLRLPFGLSLIMIASAAA